MIVNPSNCRCRRRRYHKWFHMRCIVISLVQLNHRKPVKWLFSRRLDNLCIISTRQFPDAGQLHLLKLSRLISLELCLFKALPIARAMSPTLATGFGAVCIVMRENGVAFLENGMLLVDGAFELGFWFCARCCWDGARRLQSILPDPSSTEQLQVKETGLQRNGNAHVYTTRCSYTCTATTIP